MPILKNPRWERFCQSYVHGENAGNYSACYRVAYKKNDGAAASRLQRTEKISQRIAELQAEITAIDTAALQQATERLGISKEWVLEKLVDMVELPGERKYEAPVAQRALELIGKHFSMFTSGDGPHVNVNVGLQFIDRPSAETQEEWEARRRAELAPKPKMINGNGKAHS